MNIPLLPVFFPCSKFLIQAASYYLASRGLDFVGLLITVWTVVSRTRYELSVLEGHEYRWKISAFGSKFLDLDSWNLSGGDHPHAQLCQTRSCFLD